MMKKSALSLLVAMAGTQAFAADWSTTELHYQLGNLKQQPFGPSADRKSTTNIYTLQHASGWKYGDNFFFVDYSDWKDDQRQRDWYGEGYFNFSLGKISGRELSFGPVKDVGIVLGVNAGGDSKVRKYLPGIQLALEVPGAAFFNTLITAYIDDNVGVAGGGSPKESDSWMLDTAWAFPFGIGNHDFSLEGHLEYIGSRHNEFGDKVKAHVLAQPQLRYDLGKTLFNEPQRLFVGVEYQYWHNKYGSSVTESAVQGLAVWRF
ncbi:nucleoside-binding protein [Oceanimonas sp. CHS3-5]|uniref:nucleoside-binding protein n=1 Tax=Oceanimonas sp. CHS3-5 TaxID=3068186 RepID=UPI00273E4ECA|nr:nucleoside-binding protein [Oceanimonas sp. CHS3-5]MDP5291162.1 nucleoside-binding protein [Oceanimonas sp. CHS3-5]